MTHMPPAIGIDPLPTLVRWRLRRRLRRAVPGLLPPLRAPRPSLVWQWAAIIVILALALRAGVRGYAYASVNTTRGDMLYAMRRDEELRRLAKMNIATQRAFYYLQLAKRRMQEAVVATGGEPTPPLAFAPRAFAADRILVPLHESVPAGLVLEAERAFARALVLYPGVGVWQDALVEHAVATRDRFRVSRGALRGWLDKHDDASLTDVLDRSDDADAFYEQQFARHKEVRAIDVRWLDPIAVAGNGVNADLLRWEQRARSLPPVFPEGTSR